MVDVVSSVGFQMVSMVESIIMWSHNRMYLSSAITEYARLLFYVTFGSFNAQRHQYVRKVLIDTEIPPVPAWRLLYSCEMISVLEHS